MAPDQAVRPVSAVEITRRDALGVVAAGALAVQGPTRPLPSRPRIAAVVTEYRKKSHAQGIVDRFLEGYGWQGRHHRPPVDVVSLYVDQAKPGT